VQLGSSELNASDLRGLQLAWRKGELVLCLGAGISLDHGIPGWRSLVLELFLLSGDHIRALAPLSEEERRALASWLTGFFDYDPVVLARAVKTALRKRLKRADRGPEVGSEFASLMRRCLYSQLAEPKHPTTMDAVADLIAKSKGNLPAVITFNFDDLLEAELTRRGVRHHPVFDGRRGRRNGLRIVHAHGFLPRDPRHGEGSLVFTEDEYHLLSGQTFHWATTEVVHTLRNYTVLFIGLSMTDPNLRRLLDASRAGGERPAHWQLQKRHSVAPEHLQKALESMGAGASVDSLGTALRLADRLDRELFESMGVKTVWLQDYSDVPALLAAISEG
jgi:hypothetical protein